MDQIQDFAANAGIVLMTAAATVGMMEVPESHNKQVVLPAQPVYEFSNPASGVDTHGSELRREKDEVHPHSLGYSVNQRTAGRTGKV